MALAISKSSLLSRVTRSGILQGAVRNLDLDYSFAESSQNNSSIVQRVFNLGGRALGFLWGIVRGINITATGIYGWLVSVSSSISQFDWNASDTELQATIQQRNIALAAIWGGTAGTIAGQLVPIAIGAGIALAIPVIGGAALATAVIAASAPEALEEIFGSIRTSISATVATIAQNLVTSGYINLRRFIKGLPYDTLKAVVGENFANWIKNTWGSESAPRMTLADGLENKIESVQNPYLRAFTEEAVDEFFDNFIESGFIVAQSLDQAIAEAKAAKVQSEGKQRTVSIQPDDRIAFSLPLTGSEEAIKTQIQSHINSYRQIASKDVGQIVGQPVEEWYKAKPRRRKLTIVFKSISEPPYWRRDIQVKSATYTIPDPKAVLSWEKIKRAAKAYTWGKFRATANLDNGRQMAVYGASPQEAEEKLRELLELSEANILTLSVTEEKDRNPKLKKEATRMYPATGTMLVRKPSIDLIGKTDLDGTTWDEEHIRFDLWCQTEPPEFAEVDFTYSV